MKSILMATVAAFALTPCGVALAQTTSDQSAAQLDEIVVTAERRETTVQRTPIAITAVSGEAIEEQAKVTLSDVLSATPSVQVQGNAGGAQIYIRGVGSNNDAVYGNPAVNLNVDGVYQQQPTAVVAGLYDVARVEVLRGPQGTLYGRNATGGSVNVITNDPRPDFAYGGSVQLGNYDHQRLQAYVNLPASEQLAFRAAVASDKRDGYLTNGDSDSDILSARLKALFTPQDGVRLLASATYTEEGGSPAGSVAAPLSSHDDPWESTYLNGVHEGESWNVYAQLDVDTPIGRLTVQPARQTSTRLDNRQLLGAVTSFDYEEEQNSIEARLASDASSPVAWVAGVYYLNSDQTRRQGPNYIGGTLQSVQTVNSVAETAAAFAQATVPVTDALRLTAGARITREDKEQTYSTNPTFSRSNDSFTWRLGAEYDLAERSMLYGGVTTGFKAGGFGEDPSSSEYEPEELTAYNIGIKNRFFDNRLQVNAEAFYYDYAQYQVTFPLIIGGVFYNVTRNAGEATVKGLELEATAAVSSSGTLRLGASYIVGEYGEFKFTDVAGAKDFSGFTMPNSPEWSGDVGYEHRFDLPNGGDITASWNTHFSSSYWTAVERTLDSEQPSYTRSDAVIAYNEPGGRWSVRAYVRNIEDEPVRVLGLANPVVSRLILAAPRTYGVILSADF